MATTELPPTTNHHYLATELNELAAADSMLWGFIQRASLDGVWFWDLTKPDQLYISPEYWHCLGIDPATRAHRPDEFIDVVFPEDLPNIMKNLEDHYADPNVPYEQIVRFRHASGSTVWVRCRGLAIRDAEGRAIRMLGAHNDITKVKEAEAYALAQADLLAQAYNELKQLTYRISHDLTSPINTIEMLVSEIQEDDENPLNEDQAQLCQMATKTTARAKQTLSDLLHYSRAIHGPAETRPIDLELITLEAIENLAAQINEADAQITVGDMATVMGDENQLLSLIQNLISNAIKYRSPTRICTVSINCETDAPLAQLIVADNGQGMAKEHLERIFKPFERLQANDHIAGTGLGLAVCERIVRNHFGSICVDSHPGLGTKFSISLPGCTNS